MQKKSKNSLAKAITLGLLLSTGLGYSTGVSAAWNPTPNVVVTSGVEGDHIYTVYGWDGTYTKEDFDDNNVDHFKAANADSTRETKFDIALTVRVGDLTLTGINTITGNILLDKHAANSVFTLEDCVVTPTSNVNNSYSGIRGAAEGSADGVAYGPSHEKDNTGLILNNVTLNDGNLSEDDDTSIFGIHDIYGIADSDADGTYGVKLIGGTNITLDKNDKNAAIITIDHGVLVDGSTVKSSAAGFGGDTAAEQKTGYAINVVGGSWIGDETSHGIPDANGKFGSVKVQNGGAVIFEAASGYNGAAIHSVFGDVIVTGTNSKVTSNDNGIMGVGGAYTGPGEYENFTALADETGHVGGVTVKNGGKVEATNTAIGDVGGDVLVTGTGSEVSSAKGVAINNVGGNVTVEKGAKVTAELDAISTVGGNVIVGSEENGAVTVTSTNGAAVKDVLGTVDVFGVRYGAGTEYDYTTKLTGKEGIIGVGGDVGVYGTSVEATTEKAISDVGGKVTITDSTVKAKKSAISDVAEGVVIDNSTVSGTSGRAVYDVKSGGVEVKNGSVLKKLTGGTTDYAVIEKVIQGDVVVTDSTVMSTYGRGIYNIGDNVNVEESTVSAVKNAIEKVGGDVTLTDSIVTSTGGMGIADVDGSVTINGYSVAKVKWGDSEESVTASVCAVGDVINDVGVDVNATNAILVSVNGYGINKVGQDVNLTTVGLLTEKTAIKDVTGNVTITGTEDVHSSITSKTGAGIKNVQGAEGVTLSYADVTGQWGAIYDVKGNVTATNSTITSDGVTMPLGGVAAIETVGGDVKLTDTVVSGLYGGIFGVGGKVEIDGGSVTSTERTDLPVAAIQTVKGEVKVTGTADQNVQIKGESGITHVGYELGAEGVEVDAGEKSNVTLKNTDVIATNGVGVGFVTGGVRMENSAIYANGYGITEVDGVEATTGNGDMGVTVAGNSTIVSKLDAISKVENGVRVGKSKVTSTFGYGINKVGRTNEGSVWVGNGAEVYGFLGGINEVAGDVVVTGEGTKVSSWVGKAVSNVGGDVDVNTKAALSGGIDRVGGDVSVTGESTINARNGASISNVAGKTVVGKSVINAQYGIKDVGANVAATEDSVEIRNGSIITATNAGVVQVKGNVKISDSTVNVGTDWNPWVGQYHYDLANEYVSGVALGGITGDLTVENSTINSGKGYAIQGVGYTGADEETGGANGKVNIINSTIYGSLGGIDTVANDVKVENSTITTTKGNAIANVAGNLKVTGDSVIRAGEDGIHNVQGVLEVENAIIIAGEDGIKLNGDSTSDVTITNAFINADEDALDIDKRAKVDVNGVHLTADGTGLKLSKVDTVNLNVTKPADDEEPVNGIFAGKIGIKAEKGSHVGVKVADVVEVEENQKVDFTVAAVGENVKALDIQKGSSFTSTDGNIALTLNAVGTKSAIAINAEKGGEVTINNLAGNKVIAAYSTDGYINETPDIATLKKDSKIGIVDVDGEKFAGKEIKEATVAFRAAAGATEGMKGCYYICDDNKLYKADETTGILEAVGTEDADRVLVIGSGENREYQQIKAGTTALKDLDADDKTVYSINKGFWGTSFFAVGENGEAAPVELKNGVVYEFGEDDYGIADAFGNVHDYNLNEKQIYAQEETTTTGEGEEQTSVTETKYFYGDTDQTGITLQEGYAYNLDTTGWWGRTNTTTYVWNGESFEAFNKDNSAKYDATAINAERGAKVTVEADEIYAESKMGKATAIATDGGKRSKKAEVAADVTIVNALSYHGDAYAIDATKGSIALNGVTDISALSVYGNATAINAYKTDLTTVNKKVEVPVEKPPVTEVTANDGTGEITPEFTGTTTVETKLDIYAYAGKTATAVVAEKATLNLEAVNGIVAVASDGLVYGDDHTGVSKIVKLGENDVDAGRLTADDFSTNDIYEEDVNPFVKKYYVADAEGNLTETTLAYGRVYEVDGELKAWTEGNGTGMWAMWNMDSFKDYNPDDYKAVGLDLKKATLLVPSIGPAEIDGLPGATGIEGVDKTNYGITAEATVGNAYGIVAEKSIMLAPGTPVINDTQNITEGVDEDSANTLESVPSTPLVMPLVSISTVFAKAPNANAYAMDISKGSIVGLQDMKAITAEAANEVIALNVSKGAKVDLIGAEDGAEINAYSTKTGDSKAVEISRGGKLNLTDFTVFDAFAQRGEAIGISAKYGAELNVIMSKNDADYSETNLSHVFEYRPEDWSTTLPEYRPIKRNELVPIVSAYAGKIATGITAVKSTLNFEGLSEVKAVAFNSVAGNDKVTEVESVVTAASSEVPFKMNGQYYVVEGDGDPATLTLKKYNWFSTAEGHLDAVEEDEVAQKIFYNGGYYDVGDGGVLTEAPLVEGTIYQEQQGFGGVKFVDKDGDVQLNAGQVYEVDGELKAWTKGNGGWMSRDSFQAYNPDDYKAVAISLDNSTMNVTPNDDDMFAITAYATVGDAEGVVVKNESSFAAAVIPSNGEEVAYEQASVYLVQADSRYANASAIIASDKSYVGMKDLSFVEANAAKDVVAVKASCGAQVELNGYVNEEPNAVISATSYIAGDVAAVDASRGAKVDLADFTEINAIATKGNASGVSLSRGANFTLKNEKNKAGTIINVNSNYVVVGADKEKNPVFSDAAVGGAFGVMAERGAKAKMENVSINVTSNTAEGYTDLKKCKIGNDVVMPFFATIEAYVEGTTEVKAHKPYYVIDNQGKKKGIKVVWASADGITLDFSSAETIRLSGDYQKIGNVWFATGRRGRITVVESTSDEFKEGALYKDGSDYKVFDAEQDKFVTIDTPAAGTLVMVDGDRKVFTDNGELKFIATAGVFAKQGAEVNVTATDVVVDAKGYGNATGIYAIENGKIALNAADISTVAAQDTAYGILVLDGGVVYGGMSTADEPEPTAGTVNSITAMSKNGSALAVAADGHKKANKSTINLTGVGNISASGAIANYDSGENIIVKTGNEAVAAEYVIGVCATDKAEITIDMVKLNAENDIVGGFITATNYGGEAVGVDAEDKAKITLTNVYSISAEAYNGDAYGIYNDGGEINVNFAGSVISARVNKGDNKEAVAVYSRHGETNIGDAEGEALTIHSFNYGTGNATGVEADSSELKLEAPVDTVVVAAKQGKATLINTRNSDVAMNGAPANVVVAGRDGQTIANVDGRRDVKIDLSNMNIGLYEVGEETTKGSEQVLATDGTLLNVDGRSDVALTMDNVNVAGVANVDAGRGADVDINMTNSSFSGAVEQRGRSRVNMTLDENSYWGVTGDSRVRTLDNAGTVDLTADGNAEGEPPSFNSLSVRNLVQKDGDKATFKLDMNMAPEAAAEETDKVIINNISKYDDGGPLVGGKISMDINPNVVNMDENGNVIEKLTSDNAPVLFLGDAVSNEKLDVTINGGKYFDYGATRTEVAISDPYTDDEGKHPGKITLTPSKDDKGDQMLSAKGNAAMSAVIDPETWHMDNEALYENISNLRPERERSDVWASYTNKKNTYDDSFDDKVFNNGDIDKRYSGVVLGIDNKAKYYQKANANLFVGVMFSYGDGKYSWAGGSNELDGAGVGLYAIYKTAKGAYFGATAKYNRYSFDEIKGTQMGSWKSFNGEYDTDALGLSLVAGRRYAKDQTKGFYVEPQAELAYVNYGSDKYDLDGMDVEVNSMKSLRARLGFQIGSRNISKKTFSDIYAKVSFLHEFFGDNDVDMGEYTYESDQGGSWVNFALGFSVGSMDKFNANFSANLSRGSHKSKVGFKTVLNFLY